MNKFFQMKTFQIPNQQSKNSKKSSTRVSTPCKLTVKQNKTLCHNTQNAMIANMGDLQFPIQELAKHTKPKEAAIKPNSQTTKCAVTLKD